MPIALCGFNDGDHDTGRNLLVQFGPTLMVDIGFDPDHQGQGIPKDLAAKGVRALVDTGASESCIDSGLAMQLNLPIIDRRRIAGAGGAHDVNMHLGHIYVPTLGNTIHGAFAAVNLAAGGQPHLALIGRTFLYNFVMIYNGLTGTVALAHNPLELIAPNPNQNQGGNDGAA